MSDFLKPTKSPNFICFVCLFHPTYLFSPPKSPLNDQKMQPPHIMITASIIIIYNYLFCSSNSFFNLSISASFLLNVPYFLLTVSLFLLTVPYFLLPAPSVHQSHPSSCQPSALPYSCLISSTLQKTY